MNSALLHLTLLNRNLWRELKMSETDTPQLPEMTLWQHLDWQPTTEQQHQFQRLYELILCGNRQLNLTRITESVEFWEKHLWDSLRGIAPFLKEEQTLNSSFKVIDIGTGAGFPGIPVAIALPHWTVTLLDSTRKKITFLNTLLLQLGIQNANTVTGRAEIISKQRSYQQSYDVALIRAVGSAAVCAEYSLPFLKLGGLAVLYRGNWTSAEIEALQNVVERLGGVIEATDAFTTPVSQSIRHCLYLRKVAITQLEPIYKYYQ